MSLERTYYLNCDSRAVLMTRQMAGGATYAEVKAMSDERSQILAGCEYTTRSTFSSKNARLKAKQAGWVRHAEKDRHGEIVRYDLCPVCAPKVAQS